MSYRALTWRPLFYWWPTRSCPHTKNAYVHKNVSNATQHKSAYKYGVVGKKCGGEKIRRCSPILYYSRSAKFMFLYGSIFLAPYRAPGVSVISPRHYEAPGGSFTQSMTTSTLASSMKWVKAEANRRIERARDEKTLVEFTELDKRYFLLAVLRSQDHPSRRLAIGSLRHGTSFIDVAQHLFGRCEINVVIFLTTVTEDACRLVGVRVLGQNADVHQAVPDRIADCWRRYQERDPARIFWRVQ